MSIEYGLITNIQMQAFLPLFPDGQQTLNEYGVFAIGAVKNGRACGILVFRADELTADIQHIAVAEDCRRQGIANGLIDFLCKSAWEASTAVLCTFSAADRNDPLCSLFITRGDFTVTEEEDYICRFPCKELETVDLNIAPPSGSRIEFFYKLPEAMQHGFFKHLESHNIEFVRGLRESANFMLPSLCLCVTGSDGVQAAVFCQDLKGDILLSFVYARPGHTRALIALTSRLRELVLEAADHVPYLHIAATTPESRKLVDTLLPRREITGKFFSACWDMTTMGG